MQRKLMLILFWVTAVVLARDASALAKGGGSVLLAEDSVKNDELGKSEQRSETVTVAAPDKEGIQEAPRKLKAVKKHSKAKTTKSLRKTKKSRKAMDYKFKKTTLNATALKIKEARDEVAEQKKFKSKRFIKLLKNLQLGSKDFEILNGINNKQYAKQIRTLKSSIIEINAQLFTIKDPKYKAAIKRTKNQIEKKFKQRMTTYYKWRKISWQRIESVWKQKGMFYVRDDEMNREEHEKLYQLFLIEDAEKLQFLLPMIDVERKIVESIDRRLIDIDNEKYILLAIKLMTKQLFLEYLRRFRIYHKQQKKDYVTAIQKMDKELMDSYQENIEFNKMITRLSA